MELIGESGTICFMYVSCGFRFSWSVFRQSCHESPCLIRPTYYVRCLINLVGVGFSARLECILANIGRGDLAPTMCCSINPSVCFVAIRRSLLHNISPFIYKVHHNSCISILICLLKTDIYQDSKLCIRCSLDPFL